MNPDMDDDTSMLPFWEHWEHEEWDALTAAYERIIADPRYFDDLGA